MTSHKEGGHIGVKWGRRWGRESEKYKKIMTSFIAIVPYFSYGTNTLGAQIPNMFGIQMARVCSYLEWFGFWMVKQDGHHLINHLLCRIRCIQFLFGQVSKSIGHQLPLFLLCTRENACLLKWYNESKWAHNSSCTKSMKNMEVCICIFPYQINIAEALKRFDKMS